MNKIDKVTNKIEVLRIQLTEIIQKKGDLKDPEVVKASKLLDKALDKYNCEIFSGLRH